MKTISIAQSICIEYDEILLDHRRTFSVSHFGENTEEDVDYNAKTVVRYAFDTYLRWPRPVLEKRLTMDILEKLKLLNVIKYLREREIVHYQRFGEALRRTLDRLDEKNVYALNPSF